MILCNMGIPTGSPKYGGKLLILLVRTLCLVSSGNLRQWVCLEKPIWESSNNVHTGSCDDIFWIQEFSLWYYMYQDYHVCGSGICSSTWWQDPGNKVSPTYNRNKPPASCTFGKAINDGLWHCIISVILVLLDIFMNRFTAIKHVSYGGCSNNTNRLITYE